MRSARVLSLFATLAILAAACSGATQPSGGGATASAAPAGKPVAGGSVTFALENDVSDLDPMLSGLFVDRNIMYGIYDSLVRVDPKGNIIPWLAEKWETSSDGKTVTFGALLGFLASIFAGWLGGVLAPSHAVAATLPAAGTVERFEKREVVREVVP